MKDLLSTALSLIIAIPILMLVYKYGTALILVIIALGLAGALGLAALGCFYKNGIKNIIFGIGLGCLSLIFLFSLYGLIKSTFL